MTEEQSDAYRRWVDLETRGEAICRTHARLTEDTDRRAKWMLLAELESATKQALIHALRDNGIAVAESAEKRREGEIFAERSASVLWLDLLADLRPRILFYLDELSAIVAAAPAEQRALASRLWEHEMVWLAFVDRELAGDSKTSIEPLCAHLRKWRGRDSERAGGFR